MQALLPEQRKKLTYTLFKNLIGFFENHLAVSENASPKVALKKSTSMLEFLEEIN